MPVLFIVLDSCVLEEKPVIARFARVKWGLELDLGNLDMEAKEGFGCDQGPNVEDGITGLEFFHLLEPLDSFDLIVSEVTPASELEFVGNFDIRFLEQSTIKLLVCDSADCLCEGMFVALNKLLLDSHHIDWVVYGIEGLDSVSEGFLEEIP